MNKVLSWYLVLPFISFDHKLFFLFKISGVAINLNMKHLDAIFQMTQKAQRWHRNIEKSNYLKILFFHKKITNHLNSPIFDKINVINYFFRWFYTIEKEVNMVRLHKIEKYFSSIRCKLLWPKSEGHCLEIKQLFTNLPK